jgi:hypothetical protein
MPAQPDAMVKRKKRKKTFGPVEQARLRAREAVGTPPPTRTVPAKKHKPPKHKKKLLEEELNEF